jgi:hypothetical protein
MGFCTKCGRPRSDGTRFCTGCGTEFTEVADEPDTQPHPKAQLAGKQAPRDAAPQDQAYLETQAVARPSWDAPASPGHPQTEIADSPSRESAAAEFPPTETVSKAAFWDQAATPPAAPATLPQLDQLSSPPGQYPQPGGYADPGGQRQQPGQYAPPGAYQPAGQYPPGGGYSQPDPYQQPGGYPQAGSYQQGGYPQQGSGYGGSGYQGSAYGGDGYQGGAYQGGAPAGGSGNGRRIVLTAVAALVILGAGGGAFAVVSSLRGGSPGTQSSPTVTTSAPASSTPPPQTSAGSPTDTSTTPTGPSTTPSSSQPAGTVALTQAAAGNAASAKVVDLFNRYFDGINTRNYSEYAGTLDAGMRGQNSQSSFNSGYATTTDSNETITAISGSGSSLTATVTFTSRQDPADSVDKSACNNWQLTLPLVAQGSGYLITTPPSGYATYTDC